MEQKADINIITWRNLLTELARCLDETIPWNYLHVTCPYIVNPLPVNAENMVSSE